MKVKCVWEHNGDDSILYASNFIGAFTRGKSKCEAIGKMSSEISAYLKWKGALTWDVPEPEIIHFFEVTCGSPSRFNRVTAFIYQAV